MKILSSIFDLYYVTYIYSIFDHIFSIKYHIYTDLLFLLILLEKTLFYKSQNEE